MRTLTLFTALCLAASLSAPARADEAPARDKKPAELKKLHIVMVFDTKDKRLRPGLEKDEKRLRWMWANTIPKDQYTLTVLKGEKVTAGAILGHYRKLKVGTNEGVLLFYGGHGAIDPKKGHHFQLTTGKDLVRSDLRKAMEGTGAGLVAIVSDCCSTQANLKAAADRALPKIKIPEVVHPTVRELFFRARGTVDVTGATKSEAAWGDDDRGGLFTRAVVIMLMKPLAALDGNKDGALTWQEFFPQLRKETEILFDGWLKEMRSAKVSVPATARSQKPFAFGLGAGGASYAVLSIDNGTGEELKYRFRWAGQTAWQSVTLKDGDRKLHALALKDGAAVPELEAQFAGIKDIQRMKARKWSGAGQPGPDDAKPDHQYRLRAKPPLRPR